MCPRKSSISALSREIKCRLVHCPLPAPSSQEDHKRSTLMMHQIDSTLVRGNLEPTPSTCIHHQTREKVTLPPYSPSSSLQLRSTCASQALLPKYDGMVPGCNVASDARVSCVGIAPDQILRSMRKADVRASFDAPCDYATCLK